MRKHKSVLMGIVYVLNGDHASPLSAGCDGGGGGHSGNRLFSLSN